MAHASPTVAATASGMTRTRVKELKAVSVKILGTLKNDATPSSKTRRCRNPLAAITWDHDRRVA
jgi:hypothetical protein